MRVAVTGATGTVGRHVVDVATERGHEVVACSRAGGVDLVTGAGLDAALEGVHVVVDASNVATTRRSTALAFFDATSKHLQAAARRAGVAHVVVVSIVGLDRVRRLGYYDAKLTHERLHLDGPVDASILRATQFHEFSSQVLARATLGPLAAVPSLRVQTVAARQVAERLVDVATGPPARRHLPDVGGPRPATDLVTLARRWLAATGRTTRVVALRVPGAVGRAIRDGALLPAPDAHLVGPTFEAWLECVPGGAGPRGGGATPP